MGERTVLLVHGLGSTFQHNWERTGWVDILATEGLTALPSHLPGHAGTPADADPTAALVSALKDIETPVAAVGFSAGAVALLEAARSAPELFERIALLGIGDGLLEPAGSGPAILADLLSGSDEPDDVQARLVRRLTEQAGNDRQQVADFLRRPQPRFDPESLAAVTCPVLVAVGDRDCAAPADRLVTALPDGRGAALRGVDHFGTIADLGCIETVTRFLTS